jgi:hypothetical protein
MPPYPSDDEILDIIESIGERFEHLKNLTDSRDKIEELVSSHLDSKALERLTTFRQRGLVKGLEVPRGRNASMKSTYDGLLICFVLLKPHSFRTHIASRTLFLRGKPMVLSEQISMDIYTFTYPINFDHSKLTLPILTDSASTRLTSPPTFLAREMRSNARLRRSRVNGFTKRLDPS